MLKQFENNLIEVELGTRMIKFFFGLHNWVAQGLCVMFIGTALTGCVSSVDPKNVDISLEKTGPEVKLTSYTETLNDLGLMTEIFDTGELKIQSDPVGDNTGTAGSTGGEIPRDITEILKSTLNSIGGYIKYIPYDPAYIQNMNVTGYSDFSEKLIPEVVISGGITEFDRGIETRGDGTDFGVDATFTNAPSWTPSSSVGLNYGNSGKQGLARITLDFNMLDFRTMAGIPRMNTVNSMEVRKGLREKEFGITLFGPTFGRKGSIKKVQGRHAAVRVLVEVSMIQMVGKYLAIPYWKLLGDGTKPDKVVVKQIKRYYYSIGDAERIIAAQQWAYLYGHDINITGQIDPATQAAFQAIDPGFSPGSSVIGFNTFMKIYSDIPIDEATLARRTQLNIRLTSGQQEVIQQAPPAVVETPQLAPEPQIPARPEPKPAETQTAAIPQTPAPKAAPAPKAQVKPKPKAQPVIKTGAGIGRMLSDDEW